MEKIYLASTNNLFNNKAFANLVASLPFLHKKADIIDKIQDKERLIEALDDATYDFIMMDTTLLDLQGVMNVITKQNSGLIWIVDGESETKKISNNLYIWHSHIDYKEALFRLGTSNFEITRNSKNNNVTSSISNKSESTELPTNEYKDKSNKGTTDITQGGWGKSNVKVTTSKAAPQIENNTDEGKTKQIEQSHSNKGKQVDKGNEKKAVMSPNDKGLEDEPPIISIAPPYPTQIDNLVQSKLQEVKEADLSIYPDEELIDNNARITELEPFVREYFNLVSQREFVNIANKQLAATIEMYDFVNMNRTIKSKSIGVWSPIGTVGVTTFIMNFAFHLGQRSLPISVMESLKEYPGIYKELERVTPNKKIFPREWVSYVSYINNRKVKDATDFNLIKSAVIDYKGVYWYPLGKGIEDYKNSVIEDVPYYLSFCNPKDTVLVDLPAGEMRQDTRRLIKELNELWILLDGSTEVIFSYVRYLQQLQAENPNLTISLVLLDYFPYISKKMIKETFEYPTLAILPDLNEEIRKNKYENMLLIENNNINKTLNKSFSKIGRYIYGDAYNHEIYKEKGKIDAYYSKLLDKIRDTFI